MKTLPTRAERRRKHEMMQLVWAPVLGFFKAVGWLYDHLGDRVLDRRFARNADKRFSEEIEDSFATLLTKRRAKIEPLPASRYLDTRYFQGDEAIIASLELRILFSKRRGELTVSAASPMRPERWEEVDTLLTWLDSREGKPRKQYRGLVADSLFGVADFLEENWDRLIIAVSEGDQ